MWHDKKDILQELKQVIYQLGELLEKGDKLMGTVNQGLTDLNVVTSNLQNTLTGLQASVAQAITDLQAAVATGDSDAAVEAAAQALGAVNTGLQSINANLAAALPPVVPSAYVKK